MFAPCKYRLKNGLVDEVGGKRDRLIPVPKKSSRIVFNSYPPRVPSRALPAESRQFQSFPARVVNAFVYIQAPKSPGLCSAAGFGSSGCIESSDRSITIPPPGMPSSSPRRRGYLCKSLHLSRREIHAATRRALVSLQRYHR